MIGSVNNHNDSSTENTHTGIISKTILMVNAVKVIQYGKGLTILNIEIIERINYRPVITKREG